MNRIKRFGKKNGTTILSVLSILGVIGVGVSSGIAAKKAEEDTKRAKNALEYIKKYWKYYVPAVSIGLLTCSCIGINESINKKRQTALISACALTAEAFREYRESVKEVHGEEGEQKVQKEIQETIYKDYNERPEGEEILFYDEYARRYFNSTMEHVKWAEYHFNRNFHIRDYALLNEFYEFLGIDKIPKGDVVGWCTWAEGEYGYRWIDFEHEKVVMDDGLECYILRFVFEPHADYLEM